MLPRIGPPPLGPWCPDPRLGPDPRPLCVAGNCPESQSGAGGGTGLGGEVGGCPFAAFFFFAGAGVGTTDSSLALAPINRLPRPH